jgi:predicted Fe-Mo cluster-binding NifX family protein
MHQRKRPILLRKEKNMKVGFAVQTDEGMGSLNHVHGACNPVMALDGKSVDAMVVGGIGAGAINKLNGMGIKVYAAAALTVKENLELLHQNKLEELNVNSACRAHEGGCGH